MDLRELLDDPEENLRAIIKGLLKNIWTAMPARVVEDTKDGHVATVQPTTKRAITDPLTGVITYEDHPAHPDVPIHHLGGGGVSHTFPNKKDDTGAILYTARSFDSWFQSDGTQQPMDDRSHSSADGFFLSGVRSIPRKLQQVDKDAAQHRSDDKHHVTSLHPTNGHHHKSVDPSTPPASAAFDPYAMATKFFEHLIHPTGGILGKATDGGASHSHGVTHDAGAFMKALDGLHSVLAHPSDGASLNAKNLLHQVKAHPDLGSLLSAANGAHLVQAHPTNGVMLSSSSAIALSAPSLSLPSGSISADALSSNAAATSIGALGGDLSGALPNPQVAGLTHVKDAQTLPKYPSDAAAAAGGVVLGGLYLNQTSIAGCSLLAVRAV